MRVLETLDDLSDELACLLRLDPRLLGVANLAGLLPLRRSRPGFESLASIVVSQQVSKASAEAITARLVTLGALVDVIAFQRCDDDVLLRAGLSRPKLKTLRFVANAALSRELDFDALCKMDADKAIAAMTAISGIGPWTAEVYLLFSAGHGDIFPSGDIALQNAMQTIFALIERPSAKQANVLAAQWAPHRGTAARLLWAYYGAMRGGALKSPI